MLKSRLTLCVVLLLLLTLSDAAQAANQLLKPNGEFPGGQGTATFGGFTVRAFRTAYARPNEPAGLTQALERQDFRYGASGIFDGDFQLDQYGAWVNNEPAQNFYGFNFPAQPRPGSGGGHVAVGYIPGQRGPAHADARWLQVIRTNRPAGWGQTWGANLAGDPGFTWYIDNGWPGNAPPPGGFPADPFYGADDNDPNTGYAAVGRGLIDASSRTLEVGVRWEAWAFIAVRIDGGRSLRIYDGVYWGWEIIPAPGTMGLLACAGLVALRRRRP
jgi:hypothetical protein